MSIATSAHFRLRQPPNRQTALAFGSGLSALLGFVFFAVVAFGATSVVTSLPASANACNAGCLASFNQCRISTNGSPACNAQFQACVQRCIRR